MRLLPRSLAGQMALLVALALFVAQAINLGLIARERSAFRLEQASGPPAIRLADALDREIAGRPLRPDRGRIRRVPRNPVPADAERRPDVVAALAAQLRTAGVAFGTVDVAVDRTPDRRSARRRAGLRTRDGNDLLIAVEQPGRGWLVQRAAWPRGTPLLWRLVAQTLILYGIILLPVLWIARRISRPLGALARSAARYTPGADAPPLAENGPHDVRQVIAAYNALRLRVGAMLAEKDRTLGAIGHDLRTPLAALRVRVESVDDEQDRARMVDTIEEMSRTLDDILSLARAGHPSEPKVETDLATLVDAVVEDFRDLGHAVSFEEAGRLPLALRPSLMRRAVRNLVENAVKYAGAAEVSIIARAADVAIVVADRGPGIAPAQQGEVFEAFTRLETSRNRDTGGIGLGLALARAIVTDAGGTVVLANRDGGGLVATITLPR